MSVQPVSESTNYCPVRTSSVFTSKFRSCLPFPSRFQSCPSSWFWSYPPFPSRFRSGPLLFTGYELGQPVLKQASRLRNRPAGFDMGWVVNQALTYTVYVEVHSTFWVMFKKLDIPFQKVSVQVHRFEMCMSIFVQIYLLNNLIRAIMINTH